ncbi:MAG: MATE family efflux transporter [Blautia sp.]|nr:MATE family efflux transporter [Blautia sp.]
MNDRHSSKDLTTGVVWQRLLLLFLPIAASTCIQQLYNTVDGLIVGRFVGTAALASVGGSSAQIINLLIGFFVATTAGAAVVIAQVYGAGRPEDVRIAAGNAMAIFAVLGVILMAIGLIASPLMLRILQTPEDTIQGSILYLRIYFLGVPFVLLLNMESNMLRSVGDSFSPFLFMLVGCLVNIVLDVTFVVFFHWGIAGVSIATVTAQVVNMGLLTWKLTHTTESYRLSFKELSLRGVYLSNMFRLGLPAGLQSSMYAVSNMIVQIGVNSLGTVVVASWAMTSKTDGIYWAVSNALGTAITSFIGQNMGAGKHDRLKACVKQGMILSFSISLGLSVIIMLVGRPVLGILTHDQAVISTTYEMMSYFVPFYFTWSVIEVLSAVLRGAGDAVRPVAIVGVGICLFRIVWIFTAFRWFHTLPVLCYCYPASWLVTDIALFVYFRKGKWMEQGRRILEK